MSLNIKSEIMSVQTRKKISSAKLWTGVEVDFTIRLPTDEIEVAARFDF